jgi:hypothetical protein
MALRMIRMAGTDPRIKSGDGHDVESVIPGEPKAREGDPLPF